MSELITDEARGAAEDAIAKLWAGHLAAETVASTEAFAHQFARASLEAAAPLIAGGAFEAGARSYAASDPCCGNYHLHEIENPHTGAAIPTRDGEDDL